ncbi:tripartite tricarboxylate transporter substrate binding protein [uncultured Pigmentiphaga sp.]|uniref:tripartite tricarboxylate transporter substrate binding protein n=1 Tax=uncultured Pigmentiphaga sp. TaxID=340361 RepID=UPI002615819C|nr:tripartite tricarboxylate transporter substrate binding protein [uncultured Pigmentiphaga sp.]
MKRHKWHKCAVAAMLLAATPLAAAKDVINLIIPTGPGGGTDTLFRAIARYAEPHLDATIVVQNVGGAGGTIGVAQLTRAKPDGRTMAGVFMGPLTTSPHTIKTSYGVDDYIPVIYLDSAPYVMCVRPDFPADTGKDFLDVLKASPGKYTYGTDGVAGPAQLATERIFRSFGIKARDIPYRGAGETMPALLGGVIDIYVGSVPPAVAMEKTGSVKCLLATSAKKTAALPKATSLGDLGIPDKELLLWYGLIVPAGTPDDAVRRIEDAFAKAANSPEMEKFFETAGVEKTVLRREAFTQHVKREYEELGQLVKELGLKQDG